ncbi:HYR domain-containing protein [Flavobacterium sp. 5]|uniref:HYR domain-containing protein n=1 Tax=Flavobacterium sp. 5 TaxID=2035199 RepID=UPI000C2C6E88|nr:HYR domain-containing protein [Flavobacterium sp. 5]PKB17160.1 gliding motility-associated-like protein [Flavobacterium sp. 5]
MIKYAPFNHRKQIVQVIITFCLITVSASSYSQSGCLEVPKSILNGTNGFSVEGKTANDDLGDATQSAGDINGDGIADIMIGAPGVDFGGLTDVGEIYVIFGGTGISASTFDVTTLNGTNGFVIRGTVQDERLGEMISTAGDFNHDGVDDIIVGDNFNLNGQGTAFIFYGSKMGFLPVYDKTTLNTTNSVVITVDNFTYTKVRDVSYAGDINNDGVADVIINMYGNDKANYYVVFGQSGISNLSTSALDGVNGFYILGFTQIWSGQESTGSNAGDINNDGIDDLVLGLPAYNEAGDGYAGRVVVLFGKTSGFPALLQMDNMSASDGFIITNSGSYSRMGKSVAAAGDFNNDGIDDIIIGASGKKVNNLQNAGEVYIVFGRSTTFPFTFSVSSLTAATGITIQSKSAYSNFGQVVNGLKDVNNDGKNDVIIAAPNGGGKANNGVVYVVFGSSIPTATIAQDMIYGTVGYQVYNDVNYSSDSNFGNDAAGIGDFNNDGINDFIVGSIGKSSYYYKKGNAYIFYGEKLDRIDSEKPNITCPTGQMLYANSTLPNYISFLPTVTDNCTDNMDLVFTQTPPQGSLFTSDTNVTITVTDKSGNTNSCSFLVKLKTNIADINCSTYSTSVQDLNGSNGFTIYGEKTTREAGSSVNTAGDINGDGITDFIIGAPGNYSPWYGQYQNEYRIIKGAAYLVYGTSAGFPPNIDLGFLNGTNGFAIRNDNIADNFPVTGYDVGSAGDINGDGIGDFMISDPYRHSPYGSEVGHTYIVFGKTTGFPSELLLSTLDGTNGFSLIGTENYGDAGISIDTIGDINGDGIQDIAAITGGSGAGNGKCFIIYGSHSGFPAVLRTNQLNGTNGFTVEGDATIGIIGNSVSGLGDINGDGISDFAMGSYNGTGQVHKFVIYGRLSNFPLTLNVSTLNGANGFIVENTAAPLNAYLGVSKVGDINGDGYNDIAIVKDYILFGGPTIPAKMDLKNLDGTNGFKLTDVSYGNVFGSAGDFNDDGFDDYVFQNSTDFYILFGKNSWTPTVKVSWLTAKDGLMVLTSSSSDYSVNNAGDVNKDGISDLIIGNSFDSYGSNLKVNTSPGFAYVLFGKKITDTEKPVITNCPTNKALNIGDAIPDYKTAITVTDNCDDNPVVTQSPVAGTIYTGGTQSLTLTATDAKSNFATCTFNIVSTVDTESPAITCMPDQQLSCGSLVPDYLALLTVTDNIDTSIDVYQSPGAGSKFYNGMEIKFTAKDDAGNESECKIKITATGPDTEPPTFNCPTGLTLNCGDVLPNYAEDSMMNLADNCSANLHYVMTPPPGTKFYDGISVHIDYSDVSGNTDGCTFVVHSATVDSAKPVISCIGDQTLTCGSVLPDYTPLITATDNCDASPTITQSPIAGSPFVAGMTVTITVKDVSNNTEVCSFLVNASADVTKPVITCIGNQTLSCEGILPDYTPLITVSDNCDASPTITQNPIAGSPFIAGMTVTITAKDASNNTEVCSFLVNASADVTKPVISCIGNQTLNCGANLPDYTPLITATDNCDASPSITQSPIAGSPFIAGMMVTMTAKDVSNNTEVCSFLVNASADVAKPVIICIGNQTLSCGATLPDYTGLIVATDNCDASPSITQSPIAGSPFISGMTVTMTAKDISDNTEVCSFLVNASADIAKPVIICIGNQTLSCGATLPDYTALIVATDNCDASPTITQSPIAGSPFVVGMTVTITAKDVSNNTEVCSFLVNASVDVIKPVVICSGNKSLVLGSVLADYTATVTVSDNCDDSPVVTQSPIAGSPFVNGMTVVISAKDVSGNIGSCSFVVNEIVDTELPKLICLSDQNLPCSTTKIPDYTKLVTVSDNLDSNPIVTQNPVEGSPFIAGMTVTMTVTDASGNNAKCSFKLFESSVSVNAGSDIYIQEGEEVSLQAVATGTGSFNWSPTTGLNNSSISNPIANPLETTRYTVIFKDNEGCSAENSITIYVDPIQKDDTKYGFSPDNDGINDFWFIDTIDQFPKNEVSIFNRWGDLVFQIEGYNNTTNVFTGVANRKRNFGADILPEGTYFFEIKTEATSHLKKYKGFLVLKR